MTTPQEQAVHQALTAMAIRHFDQAGFADELPPSARRSFDGLLAESDRLPAEVTEVEQAIDEATTTVAVQFTPSIEVGMDGDKVVTCTADWSGCSQGEWDPLLNEWVEDTPAAKAAEAWVDSQLRDAVGAVLDQLAMNVAKGERSPDTVVLDKINALLHRRDWDAEMDATIAQLVAGTGRAPVATYEYGSPPEDATDEDIEAWIEQVLADQTTDSLDAWLAPFRAERQAEAKADEARDRLDSMDATAVALTAGTLAELAELHPALPSAIGHAMLYVAEDEAGDPVLVDPDLARAAELFTGTARELARLHDNVEPDQPDDDERAAAGRPTRIAAVALARGWHYGSQGPCYVCGATVTLGDTGWCDMGGYYGAGPNGKQWDGVGGRGVPWLASELHDHQAYPPCQVGGCGHTHKEPCTAAVVGSAPHFTTGQCGCEHVPSDPADSDDAYSELVVQSLMAGHQLGERNACPCGLAVTLDLSGWRDDGGDYSVKASGGVVHTHTPL